MAKQLCALLGAAMVSALLAGCQTNVKLTVYSDPKYATVYQTDGVCFGTCPATIKYSVDAKERKAGQITCRGIVVRWPSGAQTRWDPVLNINGFNHKITLTRPNDAPNRQLDVIYALESERNEIESRKIDLMERRARIEDWGVALDAIHTLQHGMQIMESGQR